MEHFPTPQHIKETAPSFTPEQQLLYRQMLSEIESVVITPEDRDAEGRLRAPNGAVSHLSEQEWKMTRTPSFMSVFGNWKEKYTKEGYALWIKYQEKQSCEEELRQYQARKEEKRISHLHAFEKASEEWKQKHLDEIQYYNEFYQQHIIRLSHRIAALQAELVNAHFTVPTSEEMDYTKVLDENGEPLVVYRATPFAPDAEGHFVIPKREDGTGTGVFLGTKTEAMFHYQGMQQQQKEGALYACFANARNIKILDEKPDYYTTDKERIQQWQETYDGIWVKRNKNEPLHSERGVNLFDYVAFDEKDICIIDVASTTTQ